MIKPSKRTSEFRYAIRDIVAAADELERRGREVIHLNIGDPQAFGFRPPQHIVEAVERAIRDRFTGYSNSAGLFEARKAVADYATAFGARTEPSEVILTSGASEAADLVLSALLNPGDSVLLPAPGYPIYPAILSKLGAKARYYHLEAADNWRPSTYEIASLIDPSTKAIVLINPNNPAGSITTDASTIEILELASASGLLVISDEVYRELCFAAPPTAASVFAGSIDVPLVTLESLSKTHMLSGWRVGWMRFSSSGKMSELITAITKLASGRLCSPTLSQYAVRPALESGDRFQRNFMEEMKSRRDFAVSQVNSLEGLSCTVPDAAFYLMVRAETPDPMNDEQFVLEMLEATGVLAVPGSGFGCDPTAGYFRMVYLADTKVLNEAFGEIREFMKSADRKSGAYPGVTLRLVAFAYRRLKRACD